MTPTMIFKTGNPAKLDEVIHDIRLYQGSLTMNLHYSCDIEYFGERTNSAPVIMKALKTFGISAELGKSYEYKSKVNLIICKLYV